jgi:E3 ubiquitin-protein ligase DOA10
MGVVDPLDPLYQWPRRKVHEETAATTPHEHVSRATLLHAVLLVLCFLLIFRIVLLRIWYAIVSLFRRLFASSSSAVGHQQQQQPQSSFYQQQQQQPAHQTRYSHGSSYY